MSRNRREADQQELEPATEQTFVDVAGTDESEPFERVDALAELRREVFDMVGIDYGVGVLYGTAFRRGFADGVHAAGNLYGDEGAPTSVGPALPLLFQPESGDVTARFTGRLDPSTEAAVHTASMECPLEPSCSVSAGYAAGWYSAVLDRHILVRETECAACAPATRRQCAFEARDVDDWVESDPSWTETVLPFVEFDARPEEPSEHAREVATSGELFGTFDPLSPAIHVWGPVMVLPYAGAEDGEAAVRVVLDDPESDDVTVAVLDLAGARIDEVELPGLARLVHTIEGMGMATVVSGAPPEVIATLREQSEPESIPVFCPDVSEGIALAFQLASIAGPVDH